MARTLDLGVLFTGDASSVLAAVNQAIAGLAKLNEGLAAITKTSSSAKTSVSQASMEIRSFSQYMGNLHSRLADSPTLMTKATTAAAQMGEKYGKTTESVKTWGKELDKQISTVERVRQSLVKAGKSADAWMNTVNLVARTERGLFGPREKNTEVIQNFNKSLQESGAVHNAYQQKLAQTADRGQAFSNALEIGHRTLKSDPQMFDKYAEHLIKFDDANKLAAISTNALVSSQAKARTVTNLAMGAFEGMDREAAKVANVQKKVAASTKEIGKSVVDVGTEISTFGQYMGNLHGRLADSPILMKKAETAAAQLATRYGTSTEALSSWGAELRKQVANVERVRESLVHAGKDAEKWANTVDLVSRTERGLFGPRQKNLESLQHFNKTVYDAGEAQSFYQRKLVESADRGKAFASAFEIGHRTLKTIPSLFRSYYEHLVKFDDANNLATVSTNALVSSQAKARTATNLAMGAFAGMDKASEKTVEVQKKAATAAKDIGKHLSDAGSEVGAFGTYMGNLHGRLFDTPSIMRRAEEAAAHLANKYGTSSEAVATWGKELGKQVGNVERVRQSLVNAGKDAEKWINTVDLVSRTERGLFGPRHKNIEGMQQFTQEVTAAKQAQTVYQKELAASTARTDAFRNALHTGSRIFGENTNGLRMFAQALREFDNLNTKAALSTNTLVSAQSVLATPVNLVRGALERMDKAAEAIVPAQDKLAKSGKQTATELSAIEKKMKGVAGESEGYKTALEQIYIKHGRNTTNTKLWESSLNKAEKGIQRLGFQMTDAGVNGRAFADSINRMSVANDVLNGSLTATSTGFVQTGKNISAHSKALVEASTKYNQFTGRIRAADSVLGRFGKTMISMAYWGVAATLVYGFIDAFRQGISTIMEFDQSLKNLQAIASASDAEIAALRNTMLELAKTTKYSTDEISKGMVFLAQTGFTASESLDSIKSISLLAGGTLEDLSKTADLVTSTIRSFQLQATDSARVADVMAAAINKSKLDVEKLRIAFSYMAPAASQAGISLEETAAASMVLADSGLRASTIGTGFRQVLARLIAPTDKLLESFTKAGADMRKLNPLTSSLRDVLKELGKVMPDAARAFELFGLRGAPAAIIMTRSVDQIGGAYDRALEATYNVGAAQEMFNKQMEGLGARAANLSSKIKVLMVTLGEGGFSSVLSGLIDGLRLLTSGFTIVADTMVFKVVSAALLATGALAALIKLLSLIRASAAGTAFGMIALSLFNTKERAVGAALALEAIVRFLNVHPYLSAVLAITGVSASLYTMGRSAANAANELYAEAIALGKTEESLKGYKDRIESNTESSEDYKGALKRLALEHPKLGSYIDVVNGKFWDMKLGMEALDKEIETSHLQNISKSALAVYSLSRNYIAAHDALTRFFTGLKIPAEELKKLEQGITILLPQLASLGITAKSSLSEISETLVKQLKIDSSQAEELALLIVEAYRKKDLENARKKKDEEENIEKKYVAKLVPLFEGMYEDLEGLRRADSEKVHKKYNDDIAKIEDLYKKDAISYQAAEAEKVRASIDAIDQITAIRYKDVLTEAEQVEYKWSLYEKLGEKERAEYINKRMILDEKYKKEIATAKEGTTKRELIERTHVINLKALAESYKSFMLSLYNTLYDKKTLLDDKYYEYYKDHLRRLMSAAEDFGPQDAGIGKKAPSELPGLTMGDYKSPEKSLKLVETTFTTFLDVLAKFSTKWAGAWADTWERADSEGRNKLGAAASRMMGEMQKLVPGAEGVTEQIEEIMSKHYEKLDKTLDASANKMAARNDKIVDITGKVDNVLAKGSVEKIDDITRKYEEYDKTIKKSSDLQRQWIENNYSLVKSGVLPTQTIGGQGGIPVTEIIAEGESILRARARVSEREAEAYRLNGIERQKAIDEFHKKEADKEKRHVEEVGRTVTSLTNKTDNLMTKSIAEQRRKIVADYGDAHEELGQIQEKLLEQINDPEKWPRLQKFMSTKEGKGAFRGLDTDIITQAKSAGEAAFNVTEHYTGLQVRLAKEKQQKLEEFDKDQIKKEKDKQDSLFSEISGALSRISSIEARSYADRLVKSEQHYQREIALAKLSYQKLEDLVKEAQDFGAIKSFLGEPEAASKYPGVDVSSIANAQNQAEALVAIEKEKQATLSTMATEYAKKREEILESEAQKVAEYEKKKLMAEKYASEAAIDLKYIEAAKKGTTLQEILDAEVEMHRKLLEAYDALLPQIEEKLKGYPLLWKRVQAIILRDTREAIDSLQDAEQKSFENRNANIEYYYSVGKVSAQDYYAYLEKLQSRPLMGEADKRYAKEQMITEFGTMTQQIGLGFERARARAMSFGQTMVYIGENIPDQFASGFTSAFSEFINGTKSAAQAWQDFSRSMLIWLAEIIIKMTIMNMLSGKSGSSSGGGIGSLLMKIVGGIGSLFTGGGSSYLSGVSAADPGKFALSFHKGGIVGADGNPFGPMLSAAFADAQRFHKGGVVGLRSNEKAIVAQKGEGVFTEGQMKSLSPARATSVNITNVTDPRAIDAYLASPRGKASIVNVIGDQAFSIKRILRAV